MKLSARYYGFFSTITRKMHEEIEIEGEFRIIDLIEKLSCVYGFKFRKQCFIRPLYSEKEYFNVYVNSLDLNNAKIFPYGLDTILKDGYIVTFGAVGGAA